jgi:phospholipase C
MALQLERIKNIVVVMMENRSFDNMLGHLSLGPGGRKDVDGLRDDPGWMAQFANEFDGVRFLPNRLTDPYHVIDTDPHHERPDITLQMGHPDADGKFPLNGFVASYAASGGGCLSTDNPPPVTGYFTAKEAPVHDFFAKNFLTCDQWFSSLPAGTQPNRLMAMSGETRIDINHEPIPDQQLVFDWLTSKGISWRVYHEGMPFFALMERWIPDILLNKNFRPLSSLGEDIDNRDDEPLPEVIFIEPTYTDSPHFGPSSDDHTPTAIKGGQEFLSTAYRLISDVDQEFWEGVVMVVTYDEHGGFFDHVSPPAIPTAPPPDAEFSTAFQTLGLRVPAFVISPFVKPGSVYSKVLDHTSILKFIGTKFNNGKYSPAVDQRKVGNVYEVLSDDARPGNPPSMPSLHDFHLAEDAPIVGYTPDNPPSSIIQRGFQRSLETIRRSSPDNEKFQDLLEKFPPKDEGA